MAAKANIDYQTIEGIKQHPLYQLLSAMQQVFLITYLETKGDRNAAVNKAGFKAKSKDVVAMRKLRSPYVRKLVSVYYGYANEQSPMTKTELAGLIAGRLRKADISDSAFAKLSEHLIELNHRKKPVMGRPSKDEVEQIQQQGDSTVDELVKQIEKERQSGRINSKRSEEAKQEN